MIVDVHYHLIPVFPEAAAEIWVEPLFQAARALGKQVSRKNLIKKMVETIPDPTGERLLTSMEESGIDFVLA